MSFSLYSIIPSSLLIILCRDMCMKIKHIFSFIIPDQELSTQMTLLLWSSFLPPNKSKLYFPGFPPINVVISQSLLVGPSLIPGPLMLEYWELFWTLCFSVLHMSREMSSTLYFNYHLICWWLPPLNLQHTPFSKLNNIPNCILYISAYFKFNMFKIELFFP